MSCHFVVDFGTSVAMGPCLVIDRDTTFLDPYIGVLERSCDDPMSLPDLDLPSTHHETATMLYALLAFGVSNMQRRKRGETQFVFVTIDDEGNEDTIIALSRSSKRMYLVVGQISSQRRIRAELYKDTTSSWALRAEDSDFWPTQLSRLRGCRRATIRSLQGNSDVIIAFKMLTLPVVQLQIDDTFLQGHRLSGEKVGHWRRPSDSRETLPMDLLHCDLVGPAGDDGLHQRTDVAKFAPFSPASELCQRGWPFSALVSG